MTPRAVEVLAHIREHGLSPFAAFGPAQRDHKRAFIGGGVVTWEEYKAVIDSFYTSVPLTADADPHRAHRAHDAAVKRHS